MIRLALRELASRRAATALTALGLITASLGFVVLIGTSQTTAAVLRGDIGQAWKTPYDILVRPASAETPIERGQGLVRPNFLGAVTGGITDRQLAEIRAIGGVQIAAPVAVAGVLYFYTFEPVDLIPDLSNDQVAAFRLSQQRTADAGLSKFPATEVSYVLAAPSGTLVVETGANSRTLEAGSRSISCDPTLSCFAPNVVCRPPTQSCSNSTDGQWLIAGGSFSIPMVIAGIDPKAEADMAGLDRCVTNGRYLNSLDLPAVIPPKTVGQTQRIGSIVLPALLSSRTFVDESIAFDVARIDNPAVTAGNATNLAALNGWKTVDSRKWTAQDFYQTIFTLLHGGVSFSNNYTPSDVSYTSDNGRLTANTLPPDPSIYSAGAGAAQPGGGAPPDALDDWFRTATVRQSVDFLHGTGTAPTFNPLGQYDPSCLASFNPLAGGRLETYAPPAVTLPGGRVLGPNASLGSYVNSPPSALTNLASIKALEDPSRYANSPGDAYISAIRVKVSGADHPGQDAEHQLTSVAAQIKDATKLQVDIVKGASPQSVQVDLPAGHFGRPALSVLEPWSLKGVAFVFSRAITGQNIALFLLTLLGAGALVGQSTYTSVKRRRREFGILRALGWPWWRIVALVELELLVLAFVAGSVAAIAGAPIATWLGFTSSTLQLELVLPLAVAIALVASVGPALLVSRAPVVEVIRRSLRTRRSRPMRGAFDVGITDLLMQWRWEAAIGSSAIALGSALIGGVVMIAVGFRRQVDVTVLGAYLSTQVHPFHIALGLIVSVIGSITVAQIVTLSYLERRQHVAVLRALGWPLRSVAQMILSQSAVLAASGSVLAVALLGAAALVIHASLPATLLAMSAALFAALLAGGLAVIAPLTHAYAGRPSEVLRGE